jgi:transglutaminase-like putative cysteine protease
MSPFTETWRTRVVHRTVYDYAALVHVSFNEARLTPLVHPGQLTLEHRIDVSPAASLFRYEDYWGTTVNVFDLHRAHRKLTVTAASLVETGVAPAATHGDPTWAEIGSDAVRDEFCEFLAPSQFGFADESIEDEAATLREGATSPAAAFDAVIAWVQDHVRYERGSTTVSTTAPEVLRAGRGVCQDFVHLTLAMLRAVGIPARYVSGYVHPSAEPVIGETVAGQSHAWVEAWVGGWRAIDATSAEEIGVRHVLVARGRDYADVAPLRGLYHGGASQSVEVTVEVTRVR